MTFFKKAFILVLLIAVLSTSTLSAHTPNAFADAEVRTAADPAEQAVPPQKPRAKEYRSEALPEAIPESSEEAMPVSEPILSAPAGAEEVAIAYLSEAACVHHCGEKYDFTRYSLTGLDDAELQRLTENLTVGGADSEAAKLYDRGELDYCRRNLENHAKSVLYFAHIVSLNSSGYNYFKPSYDVCCLEENGDTATVEISESLDFQYRGVEFTSGIYTDYKLRLVKHNDTWIVTTVWSNDEICFVPDDFDLEKELADLDRVHALNLAKQGSEVEERAVAESTPPPMNSQLKGDILNDNR